MENTYVKPILKLPVDNSFNGLYYSVLKTLTNNNVSQNKIDEFMETSKNKNFTELTKIIFDFVEIKD